MVESEVNRAGLGFDWRELGFVLWKIDNLGVRVW